MYKFDWRYVAVTGLLAFAILFGAGYFYKQARDQSIDEKLRILAAKQAEKQGGVNPKAEPREPDRPREDPAIQEEKRALSKARLQAILNLKSEINETLTTLEHEVTALEARVPVIMKSDDGKKIAANPARAEQFAVLIEKDRISKSRVKLLRERLDTLIAPIDRAILDANSTYFPSDTILTDIEKTGTEARTKLRDLREIKAVMDTLQADSAFTAPGEKTLDKVISEMNAEQARQRGELIAKTKKEAHDAETKRLAAAQAKAEQDLANAQLALLKAATDAKLEKIDQQTDETKRQAQAAADAEKKRVEKAKREAKFDAEYPAMRAYLIPLTSPGFTQFKGQYLEQSETKGPISLSKVQHNLTKELSITGMFARQLSNFHNDRPIGAFPRYNVAGSPSASTLEAWYRVQDFITEFGDIMVERKLLAP